MLLHAFSSFSFNLLQVSPPFFNLLHAFSSFTFDLLHAFSSFSFDLLHAFSSFSFDLSLYFLLIFFMLSLHFLLIFSLLSLHFFSLSPPPHGFFSCSQNFRTDIVSSLVMIESWIFRTLISDTVNLARIWANQTLPSRE